MNFTEIVNAVIRDVKRPDKIQDARLHVNAALLYYSTEYDYEQDLIEQTLTISPAGYTLEVPIGDLTRFRKVDYLKYAGLRKYVGKLESRILTADCQLQDKWYVAGSSIKINLGTSASALDFSYYAFPPTLTDASPDHWMLNGNWSAIFNKARSALYVNIGDTQSASSALALAERDATIFRGDYVRANQHS